MLNPKTNRQLKIPAMGFSDYFIQTVTAADPDKAESLKESNKKKEATHNNEDAQKSDLDILESIEDIYYLQGSNAQMYELQVCKKLFTHIHIYGIA